MELVGWKIIEIGATIVLLATFAVGLWMGENSFDVATMLLAAMIYSRIRMGELS